MFCAVDQGSYCTLWCKIRLVLKFLLLGHVINVHLQSHDSFYISPKTFQELNFSVHCFLKSSFFPHVLGCPYSFFSTIFMSVWKKEFPCEATFCAAHSPQGQQTVIFVVLVRANRRSFVKCEPTQNVQIDCCLFRDSVFILPHTLSLITSPFFPPLTQYD